MFDEIDAAWYRLRAAEEREKAEHGTPRAAEQHRNLAVTFEEKARLLAGDAVA